MSKVLLRAIAFAGLVVGMSLPAQAAIYGPVTGKFADTATRGNGAGTVNGTGPGSGGFFTFNITSQGPFTPPSIVLDNPLTTLCLQLNQTLGFGTSYTYQLADLANAPDSPGTMGSLAVSLITDLYSNFYDVGPVTQASAGALQLAVWAIEYHAAQLVSAFTSNLNNPLTAAQVSTGTGGTVALSTNTLALSYLNTVLAHNAGLNGGLTATVQMFSLILDGVQDQIIGDRVAPPPNVGEVPEPASLAVWGVLGLVGTAYGRRRKSREA